MPVMEAPNAPPSGMTVEASPHTASQEALAASYENQVLAGLSGDVGVAASQSTPADLLPEKPAGSMRRSPSRNPAANR